jgi:hypothetical protein
LTGGDTGADANGHPVDTSPHRAEIKRQPRRSGGSLGDPSAGKARRRCAHASNAGTVRQVPDIADMPSSLPAPAAGEDFAGRRLPPRDCPPCFRSTRSTPTPGRQVGPAIAHRLAVEINREGAKLVSRAKEIGSARGTKSKLAALPKIDRQLRRRAMRRPPAR